MQVLAVLNSFLNFINHFADEVPRLVAFLMEGWLIFKYIRKVFDFYKYSRYIHVPFVRTALFGPNIFYAETRLTGKHPRSENGMIHVVAFLF